MDRTAWSYVNKYIENDFNWDDIVIGKINFIFMLMYSIGLYVNGNLGDKLNPKYFLTFSLFTVGFIQFLLYFLVTIGISSKFLFYIIFFVNGFI